LITLCPHIEEGHDGEEAHRQAAAALLYVQTLKSITIWEQCWLTLVMISEKFAATR
jgi:hypothetical protein